MAESTAKPIHWMHQRFLENLVNASHERELIAAVREWALERIDVSQGQLQCNLCNTCIKNFVVLQNTVNQNRLVVGTDCYDKLIQALHTGRVESSLKDHRTYRSDLKQYLKRNLPDDTFLGWLIEQAEQDLLSADIAKIVYVIERVGFAPTYEETDRVIAYYKDTRKFPIHVLLGDFLFRHKKLLPQYITINGVERVQELLRRDFTRTWKKSRADVLARVRREKEKCELAIVQGVPEASQAREELHQLALWLAKILPREPSKYERAYLNNARDTASLALEDWLKKHNPWAFIPSQDVFLNGNRTDQLFWIIFKDQGRWESYPVVLINSYNFHGRGIYRVKMQRSEEGKIRVRIEQHLDSKGRIETLLFATPSVGKPGTYVGTYDKKVVLTTRPITWPGYFTVFLMEDVGRYYVAWVL